MHILLHTAVAVCGLRLPLPINSPHTLSLPNQATGKEDPNQPPRPQPSP